MARAAKTVRKGKAISILYEHKGQYYRHSFMVPATIEIQKGKITITGDFNATATDGVLDNR